MNYKMTGQSRRSFIKSTAIMSAASLIPSIINGKQLETWNENGPFEKLLATSKNGLRITGTFLDQISHDIPDQNWSEAEWDNDFKFMKAIGIDTVVMIRCGYRKFITYPSKYLMSKGCYKPSVDLLDMYLRLADKYKMRFYFGLYDSGHYWDTGNMEKEVEHNKFVIEEAWKQYGSKHKSFQGWYLSTEISRKTRGAIGCFQTMGRQCKEVSGGLHTFISPWIDAKKTLATGSTDPKDLVTVEQHEKEWNEIFAGIHNYVDACAFQAAGIDYDQLDTFFEVNKKLADRYKMQCWTNAESFDTDMPIKFLPIKFDKLRMKLEAAKRQKYDKAITFEFSHFMSPQSTYLQAGHLYNRYKEYFGLI